MGHWLLKITTHFFYPHLFFYNMFHVLHACFLLFLYLSSIIPTFLSDPSCTDLFLLFSFSSFSRPVSDFHSFIWFKRFIQFTWFTWITWFTTKTTVPLEMIIRRDQPFENDHLEGPVPCKWLSRGAGLLQMIIWRGRPFANDHLEKPASPTPCNTFQRIYNTFLQIFSYFSILVFRLLRINIFSISKYFHFLLSFSSPLSPNIFLFFLLRFSFSLQKKYIFSLSKYSLPFPSPNYILFLSLFWNIGKICWATCREDWSIG